MDETPKGPEVCPACSGDGMLCDLCGETFAVCECDAGCHECKACGGTGRVPEAKPC